MARTKARSYLYVPADQEDKLAKAVTRGADALIIDLEDSVGSANKELARKNLRNFLSQMTGTPQIWVRINNDEAHLSADLESAIHPKVTGISLPKTESVEKLFQLDEEIGDLEKRNETSGIEVLGLIESARGVLFATEIANSPRISMLQLGELDLRGNLRLPAKGSESPLEFARNMILYASASAGIESPLGSVATQFADLSALKDSTMEMRNRGFFGRTCIHPSQISVVNEVFASSLEEQQRAHRIIELMELSKGSATVDDDGSMLDEAHLKWAKSILSE